jgi:predicted enzyme related to lactoylglutathione lyase
LKNDQPGGRKVKMSEKIEFLSAILLVSKDPEALAQFYKEIVGLPLEDEQHGKTEKHYGCELGDLHFAIHPLSNFIDSGYGTGSVKLAFTVFDMNAFVKKIESKGLKLAYPPKDTGFSIMTAMNDPDGNHIEFTQLSDRWFKHLEARREKGIDVISRWKKEKREK